MTSSQADQRLCETRGAFGSAGLMIINTFFAASGLNMDKERRMVAIEQLENYTFLYSTVKMKRNGEVCNTGSCGSIISLISSRFYAKAFSMGRWSSRYSQST